MVNDIVSGIAEKLYEAYGEGYEIYPESVKQGLEEPCFSISCANHTDRPMPGTRHFRSNLFSVKYFPKSDINSKAECYDVIDKLFTALEYITVSGNLRRGTNMSGQIVDGVLVFTVNYDFYVRAVPELNPMETLSIVSKAKG